MQNDQTGHPFSAIHLAAAEQLEKSSGQFCAKLAELAARLDRPCSFTKGQFVKWKPGLKNKKYPDYGELAIVRAVMPNPIFDQAESDAGSPYFQEPLTLVIAVCEDDDLLEFRVDGRRFQPFES